MIVIVIFGVALMPNTVECGYIQDAVPTVLSNSDIWWPHCINRHFCCISKSLCRGATASNVNF